MKKRENSTNGLPPRGYTAQPDYNPSGGPGGCKRLTCRRTGNCEADMDFRATRQKRTAMVAVWNNLLEHASPEIAEFLRKKIKAAQDAEAAASLEDVRKAKGCPIT